MLRRRGRTTRPSPGHFWLPAAFLLGGIKACGLGRNSRCNFAVQYVRGMKNFVIVLLVALVALAIIGFLVKALLWLAVVAIVLFVGTIVFWRVRSRVRNHSGGAATN